MPVTILGENISMIRLKLSYQCKIYKNELPIKKYPLKIKRSKVIKEHSGKVIAVCVRLASGGIRSLLAPAAHFQVCEKLVEDLNNVIEIGWQLDNGNYIWR